MSVDTFGASDVSVHDLVRTLLAKRRTIFLVSLTFAVAAGVWQIATNKDYRATVLVSTANTNSSSMSSLISAVGQIGSLSSLVGISGLGSEQHPEPLAILKSRLLTEKFIADNNLLPILFSSRWNAKLSRWKNSIFYKTPTLWDGYKKFNKLRSVTQDTKTNLITIAVTWHDPKLAAAWANGLVSLANEFIRGKALAEAHQNINYLTNQIANTNLVEVRNALGVLMENQIKEEMLANGTKEFAFKVIDPAIIPQEPSSPGLLISILSGGIIGVVLFTFAIFMRLLIQDMYKP